MKLINLNVKCGSIYEPLMEFIKNNSLDTDIFCFQEVFHRGTVVRWMIAENARPNLFVELQEILPDFSGYHLPTSEGDVGGLVIFIKKNIKINKIENIVLFEEKNNTTNQTDENYFAMGRNLQVLEFSNLGKAYTILNFHGMWTAKGKIDTEKRIEQSEKLRKIFDEAQGAKILCGDLNIAQDSKSMAILKEGNRNLTEEYGILSTRPISKGRNEVVDYIIVSPEIEVQNFKILKDEVADHLPLLLEFK